MMLCVCRGPGLPRLLPAAAVHSFVDVTPKLPNVSIRCIRGGVVAERGWAVYTLVSTVDSDEGCAPVRGEGGSVQSQLLLSQSCVCVHNMQATPGHPCVYYSGRPMRCPRSYFPVQYSHCTTQEDVWIGPHCVCVHLCSLLLTTGMATVGFARAQAGPLVRAPIPSP